MALQHPLLKDDGLLPPLLASLAQWHLIDDPEQGLGLTLTEALKATLREADGLKRALGQVSRVTCHGSVMGLSYRTVCCMLIRVLCFPRSLSRCPGWGTVVVADTKPQGCSTHNSCSFAV